PRWRAYAYLGMGGKCRAVVQFPVLHEMEHLYTRETPSLLLRQQGRNKGPQPEHGRQCAGLQLLDSRWLVAEVALVEQLRISLVE
ncbi:hypothetical protein PFISCL1PPCAC_4040, partial [Pristionchus fissidentatus]